MENERGDEVKLMPYDVTVQRTELRSHVFRVKAVDPHAAWEKALEQAQDYDFGCSPIEEGKEDVTLIVPVKEGAT